MSAKPQKNLFQTSDVEINNDLSKSQLTILSMGLGQDSVAILLKIIHDKEFVTDESNVNYLTLDLLKKILLLIHKEVKDMLEKDESLNKAKAFQRRELVNRITEKIVEVEGY